MTKKYILDGRNPIPVEDADTWTRCFESKSRVVAKTDIGEATVSTVFLGLDHNFFGDGPPLLFETMIFGGPRDQEAWRYSTWEEAEAGHKRICEEVSRGE